MEYDTFSRGVTRHRSRANAPATRRMSGSAVVIMMPVAGNSYCCALYETPNVASCPAKSRESYSPSRFQEDPSPEPMAPRTRQSPVTPTGAPTTMKATPRGAAVACGADQGFVEAVVSRFTWPVNCWSRNAHRFDRFSWDEVVVRSPAPKVSPSSRRTDLGR